MTPKENSFRVTLYLSHFYHDHRSVCRIFVSDTMRTVSDLKTRITEIFGIENYYLTSQNHFLPDQEDVRILQRDDIVMAIPSNIPVSSETDKIPVTYETIRTPKPKENEKKKKKRKITEIQEPQEITLEVEELPIKKKKKKKKEKFFQDVEFTAENAVLEHHNNKSERAKIPENTKLSQTINYFETLKSTPEPKSASKSKIQPIVVDSKVKENLTGILENSRKVVKSNNLYSSTPLPVTQTRENNTDQFKILSMEIESEGNEKLTDLSNKQKESVKSHVFYSSTPKVGLDQKRKKCSFGPPLMKIERKINIVKNIVTNSGNSNVATNNEDYEKATTKQKTLNNNDMEIDEQDLNNSNLMTINTQKSDGKTDNDKNTPDSIVKDSNDKFTKSVDTANASYVIQSGKTVNLSGNNNVADTISDIKDIRSLPVSDPAKIIKFVEGHKQSSINSRDTILNDHKHLLVPPLCNNNNTPNVVAEEMANQPEIVINDTTGNDNSPQSSFKSKEPGVISISSSNICSETPNNSLIFVNQDDMETMSISSDFVTMRSKRKRVRKRRKKTSEYIQNETPDPVVPFKPMVCEATPKVHIRFDDENRDSKEAESSIISIKSETDSFINQVETKNSVRNEEVSENGRKNENVQPCDDSGINENIILSCPAMTTLTPKECDIITFKILKMNHNYTPEPSNYITGKVDSYDPNTGNVDFFILDGRAEFEEPQGKFSLMEDVDTEEIKSQEVFTLNWNNLIEPRLLYP